MISKTIASIMRGTQLLMSLVIIALVGDIISNSYWNQVPRGAGNPVEINFAMFIGVWGLVSEFIFFPLIFFADETEQAIYLAAGLDGLNAIFCMSGGISLAAAMNIHSCLDSSYTSNNRITQGSPDQVRRCRDAQATTAFIWLNFILFGVSTVFSLRALFHYYTDSSVPRSPSTRRNDPQDDMATGGPMVAEEMSHYNESGHNRFGFRRERMTDGGPHVAVENGDLEVAEGHGRLSRDQVSGGPEVAEY